MRFDAMFTVCRLSNRIEPTRLGTTPMIALSVVVLPAPLRPSKVTTSPCATSKLTPCRICDSPYQACRSRTASRGAVASLGRSAASAMNTAEIGFDDRRILRHRRVIALGQHLATGEHGDVIR